MHLEESELKPWSFNGIGTMFRGKTAFNADGSFVTTLWLTCMWVPLVPLESLRILETGERQENLYFFASSTSEAYIDMGRVSLDIGQVLRVWAYFALIASTSMFPQREELQGSAQTATLFLMLVCTCIILIAPWLLRTIGRQNRSGTLAYFDGVPDEETWVKMRPHLYATRFRLEEGASREEIETWVREQVDLDATQLERYVTMAIRLWEPRTERT